MMAVKMQNEENEKVTQQDLEYGKKKKKKRKKSEKGDHQKHHLSRAFVPAGKNTLMTTGIFCGKQLYCLLIRSEDPEPGK